MNALTKLLLFLLIAISFSSCIFQPKPFKNWHRKHGERLRHYHKGNNFGGRRMWVRQYGTY